LLRPVFFEILIYILICDLFRFQIKDNIKAVRKKATEVYR